jgi:2-amino-4-hydroxy-6-hydroxymethyldihydropteridine diphosphokinase/dihydropteroate synthase
MFQFRIFRHSTNRSRLIPDQPLDPAAPWKLTQDYLNAIPLSSQLSTLTPLGPFTEPIRALKANRKTHVMRILNATPDSFSDGGLHFRKLDASAAHDGNFWTQTNSVPDDPSTFSIVDVGGQSSAPGAKDISAEEEISRVVPFIEAMKEFYHGKGVALSVDTYRASVAETAVNAGAEIINDISAGQLDPDMLPTMARLGKTICLSHMRGTPATMNGLVDYSPDGLIPTLASELQARIAAAEEAGIRRWRIILDPGIGFAKTQAQNLEILRRLDELRDWPGLRGLPWLVGTSRKRFVGRITGVQEPKQRVWGTAATVAAAVQGGADIVRVHDAQEMAQVVKMSDAIWRY